MRNSLAVVCVLLGTTFSVAQTGSDGSWWGDELHLQAEGGIVWRQPALTAPAQRIGTGTHTDGYWGLGGRFATGRTLLSVAWERHKMSMYYTVNDIGTSTSKTTSPALSYTSLPVRIGHRIPIWSRRIALIPHLSLVWSFADQGPDMDRAVGRTWGTVINNNTGDTTTTTATASGAVQQRNTFTIGPGVELTFTFGRFTALAGLEYLWSDQAFVEYTVSYARESSTMGSYEEQATISVTPAVWAMRWGLMYRLWEPRVKSP